MVILTIKIATTINNINRMVVEMIRIINKDINKGAVIIQTVIIPGQMIIIGNNNINSNGIICMKDVIIIDVNLDHIVIDMFQIKINILQVNNKIRNYVLFILDN